MKFVCDSCQTQYLIGDEKVGPHGVIVRCKKCQTKLIVKRPNATEDGSSPKDDQKESSVVASAAMADAATDGESTELKDELSAANLDETLEGLSQADAAQSPVSTDGSTDGLTDVSMDSPADGLVDPMGALDALGSSDAAQSSNFSDSLGSLDSLDATDSTGSGEFKDDSDSVTSPESAAASSPPPSSPSSSRPSSPFASSSSEGGLDDELGRAFDSVLSKLDEMPGEPTPVSPVSTSSDDDVFARMSSAGSDLSIDDEDSDKRTTQVVNLSGIASLTVGAVPSESEKQQLEEKKNGASTEWYVAIRDSQVGPLDLDGVRERWQNGELSADSLVWCVGMDDWKPLSLVPALADQLVKTTPPTDKEAPAGAIATGSQVATPSSLPPPQASELEWKPSAASALESLVKDELSALQTPAAKPEVEEKPVQTPLSRSLFDDLPLPPQEEPSHEAPRSVSDLPRSSPPMSVASAPYVPSAPTMQDSASMMPPPKSKMGAYVALGIGGGILGVGAIAIALVVLLMKPTAPSVSPSTVSPPSAATTAVAHSPEVAPIAPPAANPAASASPTASTAAATEAKANPPPKVEPTAAANEPAPAKDKEKKEPPAAAAKANEKQVDADKAAKHERNKKDKEPAKKEPEQSPAVADARDSAPSRNKVDEDFDKIFGGAAAGNGRETAASPDKKQAKTVYIPPAPGAGSAKETLGQADIMEVVVANKASIKRCTDAAKAKDASVSGTIVMRWSIRPDGAVTGVQTRTAEFQNTPLADCLARGIRTFRFPAYSGAQMKPIDFPFRF